MGGWDWRPLTNLGERPGGGWVALPSWPERKGGRQGWRGNGGAFLLHHSLSNHLHHHSGTTESRGDPCCTAPRQPSSVSTDPGSPEGTI